MIKYILHNSKQLAIVIKASYNNQGIHFFTKDNDSQQLGYMNRPEGYVIKPHRHNVVDREVQITQEVLFIKNGRIRVDFYDDNEAYVESMLLEKGDVILLSAGGHGFKMLEDSEIIEVKQGPYCGEKDKVIFNPIQDQNVLIK